MEPILALGLMSGTSLDGIDAAFIVTDGIRIFDKGPVGFLRYDLAFRQKLKQCLGIFQRTPPVQEVERELTIKHAELVLDLLKTSGLKPQLIGFHGQTIFHAPPKTLQLGDGNLLAKLTGIDVIYNFREKDCRNGGQGAPLVPVYHRALAQGMTKPIVFVNIGGVANITYVEDEQLIAFDTGPGNALLDDYVYANYGIPFDTDGAIAAIGTPNEKLVQSWLANPFFKIAYPKSLDRDRFRSLTTSLAGIKLADAVATLTFFTAQAIGLACKQLPSKPEQLILCGGGAKNKTLVAYLAKILGSTNVTTTETVGLQGDFIEAEAFAFLAVRSFYDFPISFPLTTGVKLPLTGGIAACSILNHGGRVD